MISSRIEKKKKIKEPQPPFFLSQLLAIKVGMSIYSLVFFIYTMTPFYLIISFFPTNFSFLTNTSWILAKYGGKASLYAIGPILFTTLKGPMYLGANFPIMDMLGHIEAYVSKG